MIKCDQGKCFPKIEKWLTSIIKDANVSYDNSFFKVWKEGKYDIELTPVKI